MKALDRKYLHCIVSILLILCFKNYLYSQENTEIELLYCHEGYDLTAIYPASDTTYLVTDYGSIADLPGKRFRNLVLRLIGKNGIPKDSLAFRTSIREVVPIDASNVIVNGHDYTFNVSIKNDRLIKTDSTLSLIDFKWKVVGKTKEDIQANSIRELKRKSRNNLKEIEGIDAIGVYNDWVVLEKRGTKRKSNESSEFFVINTSQEKLIQINDLEEVESNDWSIMDNEFNYWKRKVFFISDEIYFSHPQTGKCYIFNTKTQKISFFRFPTSDGLWFFTYDYFKKKKYLINYSKKTFKVHLFKSLNEKLLLLKETEKFDNYIFNDAILITQIEKGRNGEVACFYRLPFYQSIFD